MGGPWIFEIDLREGTWDTHEDSSIRVCCFKILSVNALIGINDLKSKKYKLINPCGHRRIAIRMWSTSSVSCAVSSHWLFGSWVLVYG